MKEDTFASGNPCADREKEITMPLNTFTVTYMGITFFLAIFAGIMLLIMRIKVQNPAQWKSVKLVSEWVDIDPTTGNKIKRTQTEFWKVRV